jgi:hypothetical protein
MKAQQQQRGIKDTLGGILQDVVIHPQRILCIKQQHQPSNPAAHTRTSLGGSFWGNTATTTLDGSSDTDFHLTHTIRTKRRSTKTATPLQHHWETKNKNNIYDPRANIMPLSSKRILDNDY